MNLTISIQDGASPVLQQAIRLLTGSERASLHRAAGVEVQELTARHLGVLAGSRHATAQKLGAAPSGHLAKAAEKASAPSALASDATAAVLTINHPGLSRAFRTIRIAPVASRSLAIPVHAVAYGVRAAELWDRMKLFIPKGGRIIAATIGGVLTPIYVLCKSVTQRQDRSLLPSDQQFQDAAVAGAKDWLRAQMQGGPAR